METLETIKASNNAFPDGGVVEEWISEISGRRPTHTVEGTNKPKGQEGKHEI
jgi:hypothetical protein